MRDNTWSPLQSSRASAAIKGQAGEAWYEFYQIAWDHLYQISWDGFYHDLDQR